MWGKHAHKLDPWTKLCSKKVKFEWTDIEHKYFTKMKKIVGRDVLLSYPNFSEAFIIHIYASKTQLRGVIIQQGKHIDF